VKERIWAAGYGFWAAYAFMAALVVGLGHGTHTAPVADPWAWAWMAIPASILDAIMFGPTFYLFIWGQPWKTAPGAANNDK
jgi:hypothetical protein